MKKLKPIPPSDLEKIIKTAEEGLKQSQQRFEEFGVHSPSVSFGMLEATLENTIKQLKGEYPIF